MTEHQEIPVRCPRCNGRLFDIVYIEKPTLKLKSQYIIPDSAKLMTRKVLKNNVIMHFQCYYDVPKLHPLG